MAVPAWLVACGNASSSAPAAEAPGRWLTPSELCGAFAPGVTSNWLLHLGAGYHAAVGIGATEVPLRVRLIDSNREIQGEWALDPTKKAAFQVDWVADEAGTWRLEVSATEAAQEGTHTIQVVALGRATEAHRQGWLASRQRFVLDRSLAAADLEQARACLDSLVLTEEKRLADQPLLLADGLSELAVRFYRTPFDSAGSLEIVEALFLRVLEIRETELESADPRIASTLQTLGHIYYDQRDLQAAEVYEKRALTLRQKHLQPDDPEIGRSRYGLATVYFRQGRYEQAIPLLEQAVETFHNSSPPPVLDLVSAYNLRAEIHRVLDRFEEAEAVFAEGLVWARQSLADDDPVVLDLENNLAGALKDQGRYAEAEALQRGVLETLEASTAGRPRQLARGYLNRAELLRLQHRDDEALVLYLQALAQARRALPKGDSQLGTFLNQLAVMQAAAGQTEAEANFLEALEVVSGLGEHPQRAQSLHDYASFLRNHGRFAEAEAHFEQALQLRQKIFGDDHPDVAWTLTEFARNRILRGADGGDVGALLDRALEILALTPAYPYVEIDTRALSAAQRYQRGERERAIDQLENALAMVEAQRPRIGGGDVSRAELIGRHADLFQRMVAWRLAAGEPEEAFEVAERWRARVFLDQLAVRQVALRGSLAPEVLAPIEQQEEALTYEIARYRRQLELTRTSRQLDHAARRERGRRLQAQLDASSRRLQELDQEIRDRSSLWSELITAAGQPVRAAQVQHLLPADGLMLLYLIGRERSHLFVLASGEGSLLEVHDLIVPVDLDSSFEIAAGPVHADHVERLLAGQDDLPIVKLEPLRQGPGVINMPPTAVEKVLPAQLHALFRLLVPDDLWPRLRRASEVVLVVDGPLRGLPFDALVVEAPVPSEDARYWLDVGPPLRYAPSATVLYNLVYRKRGELASDLRFLIVADPAFDPSRVSQAPAAAVARTAGWLAQDFAPLPATAEEADGILRELARLGLGPRLALVRREAREGRVREALAQRPHFVHFATHGRVDPTQPVEHAALILAPPVTGALQLEDDGFLQLSEIYRLSLQAELAVLSACDSNLGRTVPGEGAFALSRGFLAAGAQRVIASLWAVDDRSTAQLMIELYRGITASLAADEPVDYAAALRQAQRAVRGQAQWSAPYYWAPFVLIGSP